MPFDSRIWCGHRSDVDLTGLLGLGCLVLAGSTIANSIGATGLRASENSYVGQGHQQINRAIRKAKEDSQPDTENAI